MYLSTPAGVSRRGWNFLSCRYECVRSAWPGVIAIHILADRVLVGAIRDVAAGERFVSALEWEIGDANRPGPGTMAGW